VVGRHASYRHQIFFTSKSTKTCTPVTLLLTNTALNLQSSFTVLMVTVIAVQLWVFTFLSAVILALHIVFWIHLCTTMNSAAVIYKTDRFLLTSNICCSISRVSLFIWSSSRTIAGFRGSSRSVCWIKIIMLLLLMMMMMSDDAEAYTEL